MALKTTNLDDDVLIVLSKVRIDGRMLYLPGEQLERGLYERIDKTLKAMGGKWTRSKGGHVFVDEVDIAARIETAIATGKYVDPRLNGYFPTPEDIAQTLVSYVGIERGDRILEPSAGRGALAEVASWSTGIENVDVCELLPENATVLRKSAYHVLAEDFLSLPPTPVYQGVVMNPPFGKGQEIAHVRHALKFLAPGGCLATILPSGIETNTQRAQAAMRELIWRCGWMERLPDNAFREAGTNVKTVMAIMTPDPDILSEIAA